MKRLPLWLVLVGLGMAACAIPEPPPGGPEDKTPPEVIESFPEDGQAGVPPDGEIVLGFSEKMQQARLERLVSMSPPAKIAKVKWKKNAAAFSFENPLHPDTTYIFELKKGFGDSHGVKSEKSFHFAFATSAHIDTGVIAGRILFRREPTDRGVVRLFVVPRDTVFAPEATRPDREVRTGEDGVYRLRYLPTDGRSFLVWAFHDKNGNMNFEPDEEAGGVLPDTVTLTDAGWKMEEQNISIVDPREPALIAGTIVNNTGVDSLPVVVSLHSYDDTAKTGPAYLTMCDSLGVYEFDDVLMGSYALFGFLDFSGDSLCGGYPCPDDSAKTCDEPCVQRADTLRVSPGDQIQIEDLVLPPAVTDSLP
ncbi:MAG: Ig-like domain-containing protein [Candidatus Latescibacterota bacterium]|nr:MAG: Ig-like domain-containing protein [Candidatus Latescibacterota bacterium]